ncbi:hypothetical protein C0V74_04060 [Altererythrobacter sp. TH136]|nr:hypothetical protein C0V74_04060 [Altererythrobacter sp. TH136]
MMRALLAMVASAALAACATTGESLATDTGMDAIADDYVLLQLTIGEKESGYIDAFYGPDVVKNRAVSDAAGQSLPQLSARALALRDRAAGLLRASGVEPSLEQRRARFLVAQLTAAITRLQMMQGAKLSFQDEAQGLFGVRPETPALSTFDPVIAEVDRLVPGSGPLWQRVDAFKKQFDIPADRLKPVMDAAIAECRSRTLARIAMPAGERFELALVTDKPWSGYNYYQGDYHSKIEVNTDLPVRLDRAIDLGCHEGYPGHHVYNVLLERDLVKGRGWREYAVYPLYSPQSLIAEGSANYGIDLAFPGDDAVAFNTRVLAPLAGLPTADVARFVALNQMTEKLTSARYTVASRLLAGEITEAEAADLLQKYQLESPERAAQSIRFIKTYRSYIINYGLGQDMVRAHVEAAGATQEAKWRRMEQILSEPTLPEDLLAH